MLKFENKHTVPRISHPRHRWTSIWLSICLSIGTLVCRDAHADFESPAAVLPAEPLPPLLPLLEPAELPVLQLQPSQALPQQPAPLPNTAPVPAAWLPGAESPAAKPVSAAPAPTPRVRIGRGLLSVGVGAFATPLLIELGLQALIAKVSSGGSSSGSASDRDPIILTTPPSLAVMGAGAAIAAAGLIVMYAKPLRSKHVASRPS